MEHVLVTGGSGFLGRHVVARLRAKGYVVDAPRSAYYDLTNARRVVELMQDAQTDIVVHLAATVGGIGANQARPAEFFYDNLMMGANLLHESFKASVRKFVQVGTVCSYPVRPPAPFSEDDLWNGYPEETNAPYGIAKRALLTMGQAYRQQYGMNVICVIPTNLYGPGDSFDPERSHVIPALIRKFVEAQRDGLPQVTVWGTGEATREFLYVEDCADGIVAALEQYDRPEPVNLGSGREISIRMLADLIARMVGYEGGIVFDHSKPDGQPRRVLDVERAEREFGFYSTTALVDGLRKTIEWYRAHETALVAIPS